MAVKVNNTASIRKAKRWSERDDAALCVLLKRKIKDVNVALRESDSPYERARLKEQKRHYKTMLVKVENGAYNGDILFSELQASAALRTEQNVHSAAYATTAGAKKYNSSYENMDFDYETAFRKKRYYGAGLPLVLLILSIVMLAVFVASAFIPANISQQMAANGIPLNSLFVYKLGSDTLDIEINNTADIIWPSGTFAEGHSQLENGTQYVDASGNTPAKVRLNGDLGMTSVYISPFDVVKAWFRTPMLKKTRLDFLEDNKLFQGDSYYYICLFSGSKGEALVIKKDEDGNFDRSVIFRHIGTYGTIMFLLAAFILTVVNVIINVIRLFTYTSRRLHAITFISFLLSVLMLIGPAMATMEGTDFGGAIKNYFSYLTDAEGFMSNADATAGISVLMLLPAAISLIMMILPLFFKNRLKRRPTYVPAGNRPRQAINDPMYADESTLRKLV